MPKSTSEGGHPVGPEQTMELLSQEGLRIERIVSRGHCSPPGFWYDQDLHEWVMVLEGRARLLFGGSEVPVQLEPGDHINIPAHTPHRVEWTDPDSETVWLAVFYGVSQ